MALMQRSVGIGGGKRDKELFFRMFGSCNYLKAPRSFHRAVPELHWQGGHRVWWHPFVHWRMLQPSEGGFIALDGSIRLFKSYTWVVMNLAKRSEATLLPEEDETMIVSRGVVCCCFRSLALLLLLQVIEEWINDMKIFGYFNFFYQFIRSFNVNTIRLKLTQATISLAQLNSTFCGKWSFVSYKTNLYGKDSILTYYQDYSW
jgi:hypothetical protein